MCVINCIATGAANTYGFRHEANMSPDDDEDDNIYVNTVVLADQEDCGENDDDNLEDDYVNVEEMCGSASIDNDYEEEDIYQNY